MLRNPRLLVNTRKFHESLAKPVLPLNRSLSLHWWTLVSCTMVDVHYNTPFVTALSACSDLYRLRTCVRQ